MLMYNNDEKVNRKRFQSMSGKVGLWLMMCMGIILTSCSSSDDNDTDLRLEVSPTSVTLDSNGEANIVITSNSVWEISTGASWLSSTVKSGKGTATVTLRATSANNSTSDRSAVVTVSGDGLNTQHVSVTQKAGGSYTPETPDTPDPPTTPTLSVSPTSLTVESGKGQADFAIYSNTSWTVTSNQSWCYTLTKSGEGNRYIITLYVEPTNLTADRTAIITVKSATLSATLTVTQKGSEYETTGSHEGHDWVDLGLPSGTLWATTNVGASTPGGYGSYLRWSTRAVDWGGSWRMPTWDECSELISSSNTTMKWERQDGHYGHRITGKNGNSIFLPATGWKTDFISDVMQVGETAHYWSSTLDESGESAWTMWFVGSTGIVGNANSTSVGYLYSIRPVMDR